MTVLRVQAGLLRDTLVPEDECINTWHFLTVGAATPAEGALDAVTQLQTFYAAIDANYASYCHSEMTYKVYDLADPQPRVPILEDEATFTAGAGTAFPAEVAICLSYRGALVAGENPARRRGRIYLGPLDSDVGSLQANDVLVLAATRVVIADAAQALIISGTTGDARWVVFSPTAAGPQPWTEGIVEGASVDVVAGFVDDAFDTVRSRGARTQNRTVFSATLP